MKKFVTFDNAKEMLDFISDCHDLYCANDGTFVALYNDYDSIVVYNLDEFQVRKCEKYREETGDCWLGCLGPDGDIYDDLSCLYFDKGLMGNLDFCEQNYNKLWFVIC